VNVGSLVKTLLNPKTNKGKEKFIEPIVKLSKHINFHSSFELNGDVHSLIMPLNGPMTGKPSK
jgi:hypothetical protein